MPVIIHSREIHAFLPSLGSPLAIDRSRAEQQDIRPLEIAIINLMADKISTERQLALWLGNTMLQVNLTFVATDTYVRGVAAGRHTRNTPADHIHKFYKAFRGGGAEYARRVRAARRQQRALSAAGLYPEPSGIRDRYAQRRLSSRPRE